MRMKGNGSAMKFGDKVRIQRLRKRMSQEELAKEVGISPRTVFAYEQGATYPRRREIYKKLADFFEVDINYLLTEDEEFITEVYEKYGSRSVKQAQDILEQASAMFAGGELSEDDQLAFVHEIQRLYLDSKERAREKFTPKKYRKTDES